MAFHEFRFPRVYIQKQNAILETKRHLYNMGSRFVFVLYCGPIADEVKAKIQKSFSQSVVASLQTQGKAAIAEAEALDVQNKQFEIEFLDIEGKEVSKSNVAALAEQLTQLKPDLVIGVGGGKALDSVRAQYHLTGIPVALFPTAAATNAAGTRLNVIYSEDGTRMLEAGIMENYPDLILVDTSLMVRAPARALAAGIGDCIGTYYESRLTAKQFNMRDYSSSMAWAAFDAGEKIMREKGIGAYLAAKTNTVTNDFNLVVEHLVLSNGLWTSVIGGMNLPHLLADDVLFFFEPCRRFMHGELVGYSVIPMWVLEGRPLQDIYDYVDYCRAINIPVTLEELGIADAPLSQWQEAAEEASHSDVLKMTRAVISKREMYEPVLAANEIVKAYLAR